jgi:hypothetical protein
MAARLVHDEPAEMISHNPGWLIQVQRHKYSEFVVRSNPADFVSLLPSQTQPRISSNRKPRRLLQIYAKLCRSRRSTRGAQSIRNKTQQAATACYEMPRNALKRFGMLWQE